MQQQNKHIVAALARTHPGITRHELSRIIGIAPDTVLKLMRILRAEGRVNIQRIKDKRDRRRSDWAIG